MPKFLHIGCGPKRKDQTTKGFRSKEWEEIRFDIDENVNPDIVGTMADMGKVADNSMDAIFSSHNIEHLYAHEVEQALRECIRVLNKETGFLVITCPDVQSVCALVAEDKLTETAYDSPAGPIAPLDILWGYRTSMAAGNLYMAHRCGFTRKVLSSALMRSGFKKVGTISRPHPFYDLWAVATVNDLDDQEFMRLAKDHFPV